MLSFSKGYSAWGLTGAIKFTPQKAHHPQFLSTGLLPFEWSMIPIITQPQKSDTFATFYWPYRLFFLQVDLTQVWISGSVAEVHFGSWLLQEMCAILLRVVKEPFEVKNINMLKRRFCTIWFILFMCVAWKFLKM